MFGGAVFAENISNFKTDRHALQPSRNICTTTSCVTPLFADDTGGVAGKQQCAVNIRVCSVWLQFDSAIMCQECSSCAPTCQPCMLATLGAILLMRCGLDMLLVTHLVAAANLVVLLDGLVHLLQWVVLHCIRENPA
jgi:hypothetical protein